MHGINYGKVGRAFSGIFEWFAYHDNNRAKLYAYKVYLKKEVIKVIQTDKISPMGTLSVPDPHQSRVFRDDLFG